MSSKLSDRLSVVGIIDVQTVANTTLLSSWYKPKNVDKLMVIVDVGAAVGTATVGIYKAATSTATAGTAISTHAVTAGSCQVIFDYNVSKSGDPTNPWFCVGMLADTNGVEASAVVLAGDCRYDPANLVTVTVI